MNSGWAILLNPLRLEFPSAFVGLEQRKYMPEYYAQGSLHSKGIKVMVWDRRGVSRSLRCRKSEWTPGKWPEEAWKRNLLHTTGKQSLEIIAPVWSKEMGKDVWCWKKSRSGEIRGEKPFALKENICHKMKESRSSCRERKQQGRNSLNKGSKWFRKGEEIRSGGSQVREAHH